ncbi:hypothetical protein SSX86_014529 [Deinandra increscens subsp. villosa]|uniref:Polyprotein n=1 Tax=Deinandra increscens subsp. villosa TaxID=3103831 RepID=A0AAP0D655_9ASTR
MEKVPYANAVGSLMYLMVCTRPDMGYAVSLVSRYISRPGKLHWNAVKWILRYLSGTKDKGLVFGANVEDTDKVIGYVDSDFAKDLDRGRSITGYLFKVAGSLVSWKAQLQPVVALSTTEAEYIALTEGVKEALWLSRLIAELGVKLVKTVVFCDSQSAVHLSKNTGYHDKTKHVLVKWHFVRDIVNSKEVVVEKVHTDLNPADMLTKVLPGRKFEFCVSTVGIG